jgi:hypothetical protein
VNITRNNKAGHNRISSLLFKFDKSNVPIFLALILLLCSMLILTVSPRSINEVMNQESSTFYSNSGLANSLLSYAYILLLVGLVWKFVKYVRKKEDIWN